ncbi:MAG: response regulator transcription factor [Deltaproteobacteria bacterium]|nr:response regulator transcription factor [Deltaproteobacteria bacterium]
MRVVVVSALGESRAALELTDLGCSVSERVAVCPAEDIVRGVDVVFVEAGADGDLGAFVIRRVRAVSPGVPLLLSIERTQLGRIDPSWGHDDFVLLPYLAHELVARLRAIEWRASAFSQPERIKVGALVVDLSVHEVSAAGRTVPVPNREFELLVLLARAQGQVVRRAKILTELWDGGGDSASRSLDVHVKRLRERLEGVVVIETLRSVGYRLHATS